LITARKALRVGLASAQKRPRLVLGIFAIDLLLAFLATTPFHQTLSSATDMRPFADPLASGFKLDILSEIVARRPDVMTAGQAGMLAGTLAWIVLNWFLMGGVLGLLREPPEAATLRRFGAEAATHGFAMMRLQLWSLLGYGIAAIVIGLGGALGQAVGEKIVNPWWTLITIAVAVLPGLFLFLVVATAVDVARVRTVLLGNRATLSNLAYSFGLVSRHPTATIGVQFLGGMLWLGAGAIYLAVAWPFPYASAGAFALLTLLRQLTVLVRHGIRIGSLGGTLAVVRAATPSTGVTELVQATAGAHRLEA
jgi:hypothetical protein